MSKNLVNRKIFSFFLNAELLLIVWMSAGRLFQAAGPVIQNAHSPSFSDVRGMSKA